MRTDELTNPTVNFGIQVLQTQEHESKSGSHAFHISHRGGRGQNFDRSVSVR
jgi:hypothetical protein